MAEDKNLATLTVDGQTYHVISCSFGAFQTTGLGGVPSGSVYTREILLVIQSDDSTKLFDWAADDSANKDGTIEFPKAVGKGKSKTLNFKQGYLTSYSESFGGGSMMMSIAISPRAMDLGGLKVDNHWENEAID